MNRIDQQFRNLRKSKKKALVLFVTAGDPSLKVTAQFLRYADHLGVDLVELGVPFSDPLADGPVIQASSERAIQRKITLDKVLRLVRRERAHGLKLPLTIMTSFNIVYKYGIDHIKRQASECGIDGMIIPDLPLEEAQRSLHLKSNGMPYNILMISPTTSLSRQRCILKHAHGFLYYISLTGVTGERSRSRYPFQKSVSRLCKTSRVPLCVGFGVSNPRQAHEIAKFSDGVVVGSALVKHLDQFSKKNLSNASKKFVHAFYQGVKSA